MHFEILGQISDIEIIAIGNSIRDLSRLRKQYGSGRWCEPIQNHRTPSGSSEPKAL